MSQSFLKTWLVLCCSCAESGLLNTEPPRSIAVPTSSLLSDCDRGISIAHELAMWDNLEVC